MESTTASHPPPTPAPNEDHRALRISQLDATELDCEIFDLMYCQVKKVFRYVKPGVLATLGPELKAALRYVLWAFSLRTAEATIGQRMMQLRYRDVSASGTQWINNKQKLMFAVCQIIGPWLQQRAEDLAIWTKDYPSLRVLWTMLGKSERLWKLAAVVNFLIFLRQGTYQFLTERALRIRSMYPRRMGARQVSFDYMDREMLWHGFAEFLFFVLPLINFRKLKNYFARAVQQRLPHSDEANCVTECAVCGELSVNVHSMGCVHVFCYMCLMGNVVGDSSFCCPLCGLPVDSIDSVQPVITNTTDRHKSIE